MVETAGIERGNVYGPKMAKGGWAIWDQASVLPVHVDRKPNSARDNHVTAPGAKMSVRNVITRRLPRGARFKERSLPSYLRRLQYPLESIRRASVQAISSAIKEEEHEQGFAQRFLVFQ